MNEKIERIEKIQNKVLNYLRKDHQYVTVYMMNGYQMKGYIRSFDDFCIIVQVDGKDQMVYKHAVSTIATNGPLDLGKEE